jgi:aldehyde dehydrogenase (NAD+)
MASPADPLTPVDAIAGIVEGTRRAFESGCTRTPEWRVSTLHAIRAGLVEHERAFEAALAADLGKPALETFATEIGFTLGEIDHALANLGGWMAPRRVPTPLTLEPGSSRIVAEPLGVVAVIAPWNYPVQLTLGPMVAAVAAGNAVVAKPSELTPRVDAVLARLIAGLNEPAIASVHGGVAESTELLAQRFDHIFYTGNGRVARVVMRAAAEHLTPVTLELGGKSPAIVSRHANIEVAAKRIAWGKFLNAGQTCIAPDHVLVDTTVHDQLVTALADAVRTFYGDDPAASPDYARIVNDAHFHRLEKLLHAGDIVVGGDADPDRRYIAPTVIAGVHRDDPVMGEEIFGPILPVLAIDSIDEAIAAITAGDKPLALYAFSEDDDEIDRIVSSTSSGGVCVNGTLMQVSNPHLPFGGVGPSGTGAYHGRHGFDALSHHKAVYTRSTRLDPPLLYPPYSTTKAKLIRAGVSAPDPRDLVAGLRNRLRRT